MNTTRGHSLGLIESVVLGVLSGDVDLLTACRTVVQHRHHAGLCDSGAIDVIVAIESELDDIPAANERGFWSTSVFSHAQHEGSEYLAAVRDELLGAFAELSVQLGLSADRNPS
jgi:hypothetical protein